MPQGEANFFDAGEEQVPPQFEMPYGAIVSWCIGIIVVTAVFAFVIRKMSIFFRRPDVLGTSREELKKQWQSIEELLGRGDEMSGKFAVIEADKLLDHALKSTGFGGSTMGERLKLAVYKYPRVRRAWQGHLVRNQLVHDMSYHLNKETARSAVASFREALGELGIL